MAVALKSRQKRQKKKKILEFLEKKEEIEFSRATTKRIEAKIKQ